MNSRTSQLFVDLTKHFHRSFIQRPLQRIADREKAIRRVRPAAFLLYRVMDPLFRFLSPRRKRLALSYGTWFPVDRMDKDLVFPLGSVSFEGFVFICPGRKEDYLEKLYGDWRLLPEEIQTHDVKTLFK